MTTSDPIPDIITSLESIVDFLDKLISNFNGRSRSTMKSCHWLDFKLELLLAIGNDTTKKQTIAQMETEITGNIVDLSSCSKTDIENLKTDRKTLYSIICYLKELIGESCPSTFTNAPYVSTTVILTAGMYKFDLYNLKAYRVIFEIYLKF